MTKILTQSPTKLPVNEFGGSFWGVWAGVLVNQMGYMVTPYLTYYAIDDRGLSVGTAGVILAVAGCGSVVSQWIGGLLVDIIGYRITLVVGMLSVSFFLTCLGASHNAIVMFASVFCVGATGEIYRPAVSFMVAQLFRPDSLAKAYGLVYWAINIGYGITMLVGGLLIQHGFPPLFWTNCGTALCGAVIVWFSARDLAPADKGESENASFIEVLTDRLMLGYLASTFLYVIVFRQATTTLSLAIRLSGLPSADFGFVMGLNAAIIVTVQPLVLPWVGRFSPEKVLVLGTAVLGVGFGSMSFAFSAMGYAAAVSVWTLGEIAVFSVNQVIIAELAPHHARGRYYGVFGMVLSLGVLCAPMLGTPLLERSPALLWLSCAFLCCLAVVGQTAVGSRLTKRRREQEKTARTPRALPAEKPSPI